MAQDPDAHSHPITDEIRHALDWSAGPDDDLKAYVHSHPHDPDHGEPVEPPADPVH